MHHLSKVAAALVACALAVGPIGSATALAGTKLVAQATSTSTVAVVGTVVDAATGKPISGATITATGAGTTASATSDASGAFSLNLLPGVYDITVTKGGFQTATTESYAVAAGAAPLRVTLAEATSQTLRTIGTISVRRANALNTSSSAITTLDATVVARRDLPNLEDTVSELPGVDLARTTSSTANLFFNVRGAWAETKVNIDGHPLSPGTFGTWNANYASAGMFDQVEVLKGAGLNGPTAGESAFGTVNLRTRDFSSKNYVDLKAGLDSWAGSLYSFFANYNTPNNKFSLLVGRTFSGYRGPSDNLQGHRLNTTTNGLVLGTYQIPSYTGIDQFVGDISNRYSLEGELIKARYRLSPVTSITGEFLGLQGQYQPQAGAYASFEGYATLGNCLNGGTIATTPGGCSVTSTYNPPYDASLIGTQVKQYSYFPGSFIQNNEPQFSAELRTSFKNDTILLRPYVALINRFISGVGEVLYPGNQGSWFQVTNVANCQEVFVSPSVANGGAKGPCFTGAVMPGIQPAYIGAAAPAFPFGPPTTGVAPACSAATPCWTTNTLQANNGVYAYGTPFSQPEIDRLRGATFQYLHPFGENLLQFSYDYHSDDTYSITGDTSPIYPGCREVVGSATNSAPVGATPSAAGTIGYQPGCALTNLPRTDISIPPTYIRVSDFALAGLFQPTSQLQLGLGAYYEHYNSVAQTEDPNVLAFYAANNCTNAACTTTTTASAPVSLVTVGNSYSHFDPHLGLTFRAAPSFVVRASAGSSVTMPYAFLISGLGSVTIPNAANNQQYTVSLANTGLKPETTVAYDLGFDVRAGDGGIFSVDAFNNTVHNVFMAQSVAITCPASFAAAAIGGCFQSQTVNGPIARYYGLEMSLTKQAPVGFGYTFTTTLERAYYDQLPLSLYATGFNALVSGKQLDAGTTSQGSIPFAKGYGELRWAGARNQLFTFGARWEGANNETYGPAYTIFNSTLRFDLFPQTTFQMAIDNVFNYQTGTDVVRALFGQGNKTITAGLVNGVYTFSNLSTPKSIQQLLPRTVRFTLSRRIQ